MADILQMLADKSNYGGRRKKVEYIVVHYTANKGDTAVNNGKYFQGKNRNASAHYFVDEDRVVQSVPDTEVAWSVGGKKYPNCQQTGGGKFYGKCTNYNSISVELCNGIPDFPEKTILQAVNLIKSLMRRYSVPKCNVIRHFDVTGKNCPAPFVVNKNEWQDFLNRLASEENEEMTRYYESITEVPTWAKEMVKEQIEKGCYADTGALHISEDMLRTMAIRKRENPYYETIDAVPTWAKEMVKEQIDKGCYADTEKLHLNDDMLRGMAILKRLDK